MIIVCHKISPPCEAIDEIIITDDTAVVNMVF